MKNTLQLNDFMHTYLSNFIVDVSWCCSLFTLEFAIISSDKNLCCWLESCALTAWPSIFHEQRYKQLSNVQCFLTKGFRFNRGNREFVTIYNLALCFSDFFRIITTYSQPTAIMVFGFWTKKPEFNVWSLIMVNFAHPTMLS